MVVYVLVILVQLTLVCTQYAAGEPKRCDYSNYTVFRIVPSDQEELAVLKSMAEKEKYQFLDFWKPPNTVNQAVDVMVPPDHVVFIEQFLATNKIPRTVLMSDVERYLSKERLDMERSSLFRVSRGFFANYRNLEEIYNFIDELAEGHPNITSVFSIGKSYEGRDLKVIRIGSKTSSTVPKPAIWIDSGFHAREWIGPATAMYISQSLVSEYYDGNNDVKELVDYFDWYFLPMANPDGYVYSFSVNRFWRKTRRGLSSQCFGVDLNRNFPFHWGEEGSSDDPCSDTYAGPQPFSEPESKAIADFILKQNETFVVYLSIHSYSQKWLTPWGWTKELPKDYDDLEKVAKEAVEALYEFYGTKYEIGSSPNVHHFASGMASDWAKGVAGIKYSYTAELRDTGKYGVLLPPEQILPTGEETWAGVQAMAKAVKRDL